MSTVSGGGYTVSLNGQALPSEGVSVPEGSTVTMKLIRDDSGWQFQDGQGCSPSPAINDQNPEEITYSFTMPGNDCVVDFQTVAAALITAQHQGGSCSVTAGQSCTASGGLSAALQSPSATQGPYTWTFTHRDSGVLNQGHTITETTSDPSVSINVSLTGNAPGTPGEVNSVNSSYDLEVTDSVGNQWNVENLLATYQFQAEALGLSVNLVHTGGSCTTAAPNSTCTASGQFQFTIQNGVPPYSWVFTRTGGAELSFTTTGNGSDPSVTVPTSLLGVSPNSFNSSTSVQSTYQVTVTDSTSASASSVNRSANYVFQSPGQTAINWNLQINNQTTTLGQTINGITVTSPQGSSATPGTTVTLNFQEGDDWRVTGVQGDGVAVSWSAPSPGTATFTMPSSTPTIRVYAQRIVAGNCASVSTVSGSCNGTFGWPAPGFQIQGMTPPGVNPPIIQIGIVASASSNPDITFSSTISSFFWSVNSNATEWTETSTLSVTWRAVVTVNGRALVPQSRTCSRSLQYSCELITNPQEIIMEAFNADTGQGGQFTLSTPSAQSTISNHQGNLSATLQDEEWCLIGSAITGASFFQSRSGSQVTISAQMTGTDRIEGGRAIGTANIRITDGTNRELLIPVSADIIQGDVWVGTTCTPGDPPTPPPPLPPGPTPPSPPPPPPPPGPPTIIN